MQNSRTIIFGEEVRKKIINGVTKTERAVATTLGSRGRNVSMERNWGEPIIIHDGVTVAKNVVLEDPYENQAAKLVISAAQKTNDEAGDGTTTATILTKAFVTEGFNAISSGVNPALVRRGIEHAVKVIVDELHKMAKEVKEFDELKNIATISVADEELGKQIAEAVQNVGENGIVTVQEGRGFAPLTVEYKEGMEVDKGWINEYMINDETSREAILPNPHIEDHEDKPVHILVCNQQISLQDGVSLLTPLFGAKQKNNLLFIADDFSQDFLAMVNHNRRINNTSIVLVKSPEFGDHRTNILTDICMATGATLIGGPNGIEVKNFSEAHYGKATQTISNKNTTVIINGEGEEQKINDRIEGIKKQINTAETEFIKEKYQIRLAKLNGGVAVLTVGGKSETEMVERRERVFDAKNATVSAVEEGIVPGGGVALLKAAKKIQKMLDNKEVPDEERDGFKIVINAVKYPIKKLIENAGTESADYAVRNIVDHKDVDYGYNVNSEKYENLYKTGVIDPVKVTRSALTNAASISIMLLTTDCMISFKRKEPTTATGVIDENNLIGVGKI